MNWRKYKVAKWGRNVLNNIGGWWRHSSYSPHNIRWALYHKFVDKPNTIKVGYFSDWQWVDKSNLARHLPFVLLKKFIEEEKPFEYLDTDWEPHREMWKELKELYEWYEKFEEFDHFEYMQSRLGYTPELKMSSSPLESAGLNEWGEPKLYSMDFGKKSDYEEEVRADAYAAEAAWEQEFTDKACRVIQLCGLMWV